jgi:hypothetical protein
LRQRKRKKRAKSNDDPGNTSPAAHLPEHAPVTYLTSAGYCGNITCMRTSSILILVVFAAVMIGLDAGIMLRARRLHDRRIWLLPVIMLAAYLWIWASVEHVAWLYAPGAALIVAWIAVSAVAAHRSRHRSKPG